MACLSPITVISPAGPVEVRCKQCLQCRIARQSGLALQCVMEQSQSLCADFWTLTYRDAPEEFDYKDFSLFLKRLRKWNRSAGNLMPIRYFACGEYGSKSGRPHYHALIFNALSPDTDRLRTRLWPHGFVYIGTVTHSSIRYTARYCLKFGEKGDLGFAHWSTKPVLGHVGMALLGQYMRLHQPQALEAKPPTMVEIEGKRYQLNDAMRKAFAEGAGLEVSPRAALRHMDYLLRKRYGDPVEADRRRAEARDFFFRSCKFGYEKI